MNDNINKVRIASIINDMFYDRLRYLKCSNMDNTEEYIQILNKLKHTVKVENDEYHNLSTDDLLNDLIDVEKNKSIILAGERQYSKLMYEKRLREGSMEHDDILLSDVIAAKMMIDVLKKLDNKMNIINNNEDMDPDDIMMLNIYYKIHTFTHLTMNNFLELLSIKYKFNIKKMPVLHFTEFENSFNVELVSHLNPMCLKYAIDTAEDLFRLRETDKYSLAYAYLFDLSRIECILDYLDKDMVREFQKYIDYNFVENDVKSTVKSLIKKRKEELS